MKVFISGQKYFGGQVLKMCIDKGLKVVGVCCPVGDKYIGKTAALYDIPITPSGMLNGDSLPDNIDLGITAHSFDYIGKRTRYKPKYGWIGYHPSLLPRHRGRSAIEWAIRMKDPVTGGTVFWLNAGIDRGDIAYQDWCFIPPALFNDAPAAAARELWEDKLQDIGISLISKALDDISMGIIVKQCQDSSLSTWEPSTKVNDIYRPDALMLEGPSVNNYAKENNQ